MISLEPYLRIIPAILFLHASVLVGCATQLKPKDRTPPIAPIEPHIVQLHGKRHLDNYFWLKSPRDHRREIYIESENRYAQESLKDLKPLQESIYREMFERININDSSVPFQWGPYIYSSRLVQGLPFPIHMRTPVSDPTKEEVVLDLNTIVRRYPQAKLGAFRMSPDHRFVAFTLKEQAGRPYSLYIQSIEKPAVTYIATQISEIEWGHDAKSIYYLKQNDLGRSDELFLVENLPQVIKASKSISARENLVYRETDPAYHLRLSRSKNGRFVFFSAESVNTRQAFYIDLKTSAHTAKPLRPRIEGTKDTLGHRGNKFLIKSEENGRNAILFSTDVNSPERSNWLKLLDNDESSEVVDFSEFEHGVAVLVNESQTYDIKIILDDLDPPITVSIPEKNGLAKFSANPNFDSSSFTFKVEAPNQPRRYYLCDLLTGATRLIHELHYGGDAQSVISKLKTHREFISARDGVQIPVTLTYLADHSFATPSPLLLEGYSAYGEVVGQKFDPEKISLLKRGVVYATCHGRGGGFFGTVWHRAGQRHEKDRAINDFLDCSHWLIQKGYTSPSQLLAYGQSAGGVVVAGAINKDPGLFRSVILDVPFVDVLGAMLDTNQTLTVREREEWGDPSDKDDFDAILRYSPYENITNGLYPSVLVRAGYLDNFVSIWETAKWVSKLRAESRNPDQIYLFIRMDAGHFGASQGFEEIRDRALMYSFLISQVQY